MARKAMKVFLVLAVVLSIVIWIDGYSFTAFGQYSTASLRGVEIGYSHGIYYSVFTKGLQASGWRMGRSEIDSHGPVLAFTWRNAGFDWLRAKWGFYLAIPCWFVTAAAMALAVFGWRRLGKKSEPGGFPVGDHVQQTKESLFQ